MEAYKKMNRQRLRRVRRTGSDYSLQTTRIRGPASHETPPSRRRKRMDPRTSVSSSEKLFSWDRISLFTILLLHQFSLSASHQYGECYRQLQLADGGASGDKSLNRDEFAQALQLITYGAIDANNYGGLSNRLKNYWNRVADGTTGTLNIAGVDPPISPNQALDQFCLDTYNTIIQDLELDLDVGSCKVQMSLGDRGTGARSSLDFRLQRTENEEYAVFVDKMAGKPLYGDPPSWTNLPEPIQRVFSDFQDPNNPNEIDIRGALPFSPADQAQLERLDVLCRQIVVAIAAGLIVDPPPTPAPNPPPDNSYDTDFTMSECVSSMVFADLQPSNNLLSQNEFVRFIQLVAGRNANLFKFLPQTVQDLYFEKATEDGTDGVSILGARYGDRTITRTIALETFCEDLRAALIAGASETQFPTIAPTTSPPIECTDIPFSKCTLSMATSEIGSRSNSLDKLEYVVFLNKATDFLFFRDYEFEELDPALVDNFNTLATTGGEIPIDGSFPGLPTINRTPEQNQTLLNICESTSEAIELALCPSPTQAPTPSPTRPGDDTNEPTGPGGPGEPASDGNVTIFNAFVISVLNLTESDLLEGDEFEALNGGYEKFMVDVVNGLSSSAERGRNLRGTQRFLPATGVVDDTARVYDIEEVDCPSNLNVDISNNTNTTQDVLCHTAYASFDVAYVNEPDVDAFALSITEATQNALNQTDSDLQSYIIAENPETQISVEGVPTDGSTRPLVDDTQAPTPAPGITSSGGDGGGGVGLIIGIIIGLLVVGCCVGYFVWQRIQNGESLCCCFEGCSMPSMPSRPNRQKQSRSEDEDGFDDEYKDDDGMPGGREMARPGMLQSPSASKFGAIGQLGRGRFDKGQDENKEDETAGFSIQEQDQEEKSAADMNYGAGGNAGPKAKGFGSFGKGMSRRGSLGMAAGMAQMYRNRQAEEKDENSQPPVSPSGSRASIHSRGDYGFDDGSVSQGRTNSVSGGSAAWGQGSPEQGKNSWGGGMWGDTPDEADEASEEEESDYTSGDDDEDDDDYSDDDDDEDGQETFEDEDEETSSSEANTYNDDGKTTASELVPGNMKQFNSMVETGDWDGVIGAASGFGTASKDDEDSYVPRRASLDNTYTSGLGQTHLSGSVNRSDSDSDSESDETTSRATSAASSSQGTGTSPSRSREGSVSVSMNSFTSQELREREDYRKRVVELVKKVVPDEADNVANMMDQFAGREEELINTLQTMYERSYSVRARKAMHKSKGIPEDDMRSSGRLGAGGTEGSAAVAAASTIGVGFERPMENFDDGDDDDDESDSYSDSEDESDSESNSDDDYEGEGDPGSLPSFDGDLGLDDEDDDDDDYDSNESESYESPDAETADYDVQPSFDDNYDDDEGSSSGSYEDDDDGGFGDAISNDFDDDEDSSYSSDSSYEDS